MRDLGSRTSRCAIAAMVAVAAPGAGTLVAGQVGGELLVGVRVVSGCTANMVGDAVTQDCTAASSTGAGGEQPEPGAPPIASGPAASIQVTPDAAAKLTYLTLIY